MVQKSGHKNQGTKISAQKSGHRNQGTEIRAQKSGHKNQGTKIRAQKSRCKNHGIVVRGCASHHHTTGLIPGPGVICAFSLLLVLFLTSFLLKSKYSEFQLDLQTNRGQEQPPCGMSAAKSQLLSHPIYKDKM